MFRVLIVEDDVYLCKQLESLLKRDYRVFIAHSLQEVDTLLNKKKFELILLDRLLADGDTLELLSYIRECSPATRILMMSARGDVEERIKGLSEGADDYVAKPLDVQEVLLRVRRLLQCERSPLADWQEVGSLRFNRVTGEAHNGEMIIHLRPREAQILSCLLRFKNQVVTRDAIVSQVWGSGNLPTNTTLDVYLRRLRMMLGDTSKYIETVRGFGYLIRDPAVAYK